MPTARPMPAEPRGFGPIAPHPRTMPAQPATVALTNSDASVGDAAQSMSDEEREYAIKQAGQDVEAAQARWEAHGLFHDCAARDDARRYMQALIACRSTAQIARMEASQAERMAMEPGA